MRLYFAALCPWLLPLAGVCLLFVGLTPHGLGTRLNDASTVDGIQPHPACVNPTRRVQLRLAYLCYQRQVARVSQAKSVFERNASRAAVREAVGSYNQVAADTDPSAFEGTCLPYRLAAPHF